MQKGGTSWLFDQLGRHPEIGACRVKEAHFFDNEALNWALPDYGRLHRLFDFAAPGVQVWGEATPITTYWPRALARLRAYNPQARLILCLRHPGFRAYSQWRMSVSRGQEPLNFARAISARGRDRVRAAPGRVHRVFSYVERGFYSGQIRRVLAQFPQTQMHALRTDRLWAAAGPELAAIERFLGVSPWLEAASAVAQPVVIHSQGPTDDMPAEARQLLDALYRDDILQTADLTGLDLGDWLSPDYVEPMGR